MDEVGRAEYVKDTLMKSVSLKMVKRKMRNGLLEKWDRYSHHAVA